MIFSEELYQIEDCVDDLAQRILTSSEGRRYIEKKVAIETNPTTLEKRSDFLSAKRKFEQIEAFGDYAPDFTELRRNLRKTKRALDLDDEIAEYHYAETQLQGVLDTICQKIAHQISTDIKVDAGNPFFETGKKSCGGSCHVG